MLRENLARLEDRILRSCAAAGRARNEVRLIAVTKVFPVDVYFEAHALGLRHFGENYVQEMEGKAEALRQLPDAIFHLIGHLQSNKARRAAELFHCIDALDSRKAAARVNESPTPRRVLVEVKLSPEDSKHGVLPDELPALLDELRPLPQLELRGLMTMPPYDDDAEKSRPYFTRLRELSERFALPELSMGMSHDLEVAIAEGATEIRVGTALFGERKRPA
jgi:PLP dependent protein